MRPFAWLWILGAVFFGVFLILLGVAFVSGLFVGQVFPFYRPFFLWPFGWLFGLFLLFFLFRFLFWPWGWGWGYRRHWDDDRAYMILRERYAHGELSKEQFEAMMRDLEQHRV